MDSGRLQERAIVKIADHTPKSILRNVYTNENVDERSPSRMAATSAISRHRVGASPVRVKRSISGSVPTAVVTPSPPIRISTKTTSEAPRAISAKATGDAGPNRYVSLRTVQTEFSPALSEFAAACSPIGTSFANSTPLSRRSHSSAGAVGLGLLARKLDYEEFGFMQQQQQQERSWLGDDLDAEYQVPSNSILTLHPLDDSQIGYRPPRDDSQERRLEQLEAKLRELEMRLASTNSPSKRDAAGPKEDLPKAAFSEIVGASREAPMASSPLSSRIVTKGKGSFGVVSVAVPPMMALDAGIYRVQPAPRSEIKVQREVERLEKKLKHQEEMGEVLRAQHFKQIEQLTRQLALNEDMAQTLRSRIRELELENELWQNRFRLYNDVDVAKILRENERLRSRQRKRSSRGEEENGELLRKKEQIAEEHRKLSSRHSELEQKYRALKDKYKESLRAYRTRCRQDHIELESLKVTIELQNAELADLRERVLEQTSIAAGEVPAANASTTTGPSASSNALANGGCITYNLEKCNGIAECLSKICTHLKRKEPLDPTEVLDYGASDSTGAKALRDKKTIGPGEDKSLDGPIEDLASKMTKLHSMVVDLYGDDLANAVNCSVQ